MQGEPEPEAGAQAAIELGWLMAELYMVVRPDQLQPPKAPEHPLPHLEPKAQPRRLQLQEDLPGIGKLTERHDVQLQLLTSQVTVGFGQLAPRLRAAGLALEVPTDWDWLRLVRNTDEGVYQLARSVLQFHDDLFVALTACDHQLGLAYGLGRALADLVQRPQAGQQQAQLEALTDDLHQGRVDTIASWLAELRNVLPPHSAGAVIGSIRQWQAWADHPTWHGEPLVWSPERGREISGRLISQGQRWRLLLTGQVVAVDQLSPDDYVQAAGYTIGRIREILQRIVVQYWPWVAALTLVMIAAVIGSLTLLDSAAAKGIGVAVSVFGYLGITGRTLSTELQRAVSQIEESLWQAELDLAAAWANTLLPDADAQRQLNEAQAPRLPFGRPKKLAVQHAPTVNPPPAPGPHTP